MAKTFTYFDDVVDLVKDVLDGWEDFSQNYDCRAIAEHVSDWDEDLQKFVLTKKVDDDDFWDVVFAYELA